MLTSKSGRKLGKNALKLGGVAAAPPPRWQQRSTRSHCSPVQVDSPAGSAYLTTLAARLRLPDELATTIHEQVDQQRVAAGVSPDETV